MEPIFMANEKEIWYLVAGQKESAMHCPGKDCVILDSSKAEGAGEKHLPAVEREGQRIRVQVGSVLHPMSEEHSIEWIYLDTKKGGQFYKLCPDGQPVAEFVVAQDDEAVAVYAYCNLHGFWKTELS